MNRIPLTGKELRIAAVKGLAVRYVEQYANPADSHMNFNGICIMEPANIGYYIGNSDINPEDFTEDVLVEGEFPEGTYGVYRAPKVKYE